MNNTSELRKVIVTPLGEFTYYSLPELLKEGIDVEEFPFSIRILLENIIRNYNGVSFSKDHLTNIINWSPRPTTKEIAYLPARY